MLNEIQSPGSYGVNDLSPWRWGWEEWGAEPQNTAREVCQGASSGSENLVSLQFPFSEKFPEELRGAVCTPFCSAGCGPKVFVRIRCLGALRHEPTQMAMGEAFLGCCFMHQMLKYVWVETTEACLV